MEPKVDGLNNRSVLIMSGLNSKIYNIQSTGCTHECRKLLHIEFMEQGSWN